MSSRHLATRGVYTKAVKRAVTRLAVVVFGTTLAAITVLAATTSAIAESPSPAAQAWFARLDQCKALPHTDCAVAEDGWTFAITDPGCSTLPQDHGRFVAYRAGMAVSAVLGLGSCDAFNQVRAVVAGFEWSIPGAAVVRHEMRHWFAGKATFYDPGGGACGGHQTGLVVAMPSSMYDSPAGRNLLCGKHLRVYRGNRSVVVTVVDRCAGCAFGDIDLSRTAFERLAAPGAGRVEISWEFVA